MSLTSSCGGCGRPLAWRMLCRNCPPYVRWVQAIGMAVGAVFWGAFYSVALVSVLALGKLSWSYLTQ